MFLLLLSVDSRVENDTRAVWRVNMARCLPVFSQILIQDPSAEVRSAGISSSSAGPRGGRKKKMKEETLMEII